MFDTRWGIYIDIEGFGFQYNHTMKALLPLNALMEGIYQIGRDKYNDDVSRLFAHQFGDGFVVVSCFEEKSLDRPVAIAISLMRHVLAAGGLAKASVSEGGFEDIKGCYPRNIIDNEKEGSVAMGAGLMTIIPVMGTALINAVALDKRSPSGSLLTIDSVNAVRLSKCFAKREIENGLVSINWLKGDQRLVSEISADAGLENPPEKERELLLRKYISNNKLKSSWIRTTCYEQEIFI